MKPINRFHPCYAFTILLYFVLTPLPGIGADLPSSRNSFIVIAHRGNHERAHENTLTAIEHAIAAGVDYVEIDVRRTVDGKYVLMHDDTVDRMTDGHGSVAQMTLSQLQSLRVRDPKRPLIASDRIPTFDEVLRTIEHRINIYLDFKDGDRAVVAKIIRRAGIVRQVLVYDDVDSVAEWRRVAPELPLIVSSPKGSKDPQQIAKFARTLGIEVLDGSWQDYSPESVDAARRAGVQTWPDIQATRENTSYFERVVARGFTGVQTDHPEELIDWLKQQGRR